MRLGVHPLHPPARPPSVGRCRGQVSAGGACAPPPYPLMMVRETLASSTLMSNRSVFPKGRHICCPTRAAARRVHCPVPGPIFPAGSEALVSYICVLVIKLPNHNPAVSRACSALRRAAAACGRAARAGAQHCHLWLSCHPGLHAVPRSRPQMPTRPCRPVGCIVYGTCRRGPPRGALRTHC